MIGDSTKCDISGYSSARTFIFIKKETRVFDVVQNKYQ